MRKALSLRTNNVTNQSQYQETSKRVSIEEDVSEVVAKKEKRDEAEHENNNMIHELERRLEEKKNEEMDKKSRGVRNWVQKNWKPTVGRRAVEKDAVMVVSGDYFTDMLQYMKDREMRNRPRHDYILDQEHVDRKMRMILVDWLHDVTISYSLQTETLHLTVSIVDRYVSMHSVRKEILQLVGTAGLLIASKYEEKYVEEIEVFSNITQNTYTVEQIIQMEVQILQKLDFAIALPTALWFGSCFVSRLHFTRKMKRTAQYLLNLSLMEVDFLRYQPSFIAAAAICFTNILSGKTSWSDETREDTGVAKEEFGECLKALASLFTNAPEANRKMYTKYSSRENDEVALLEAPNDALRDFFLLGREH